MDCHTALTPTTPSFPFSILDEEEIYKEMANGLELACRSGDLHYLQSMEELFDGVEYDDFYAEFALTEGYIEFFKRYIMLCRMNFILTFDPLENWFWRDYLDPLLCILRAPISDQIRLHAVEFYFDDLVPNLPSREEVVPCRVIYQNSLIKLPTPRHTIWSISDSNIFDDPTDRNRFLSSALHYPSRPILEFLTGRLHMHFTLYHLYLSVYKCSRSLYSFVLDHLDPNLDKSKLPVNCRFEHDPSDADFVTILFEASELDRSDSVVWEFLESYPEFRYKIPSVIEWIRTLQALSPSSPVPRTMRFYKAPGLDLSFDSCVKCLEFVEHIASILGSIDHSEPIQFDSKLMRQRIPEWEYGLSDEMRMAAALSEPDQKRRKVSDAVQEQRYSSNDPYDSESDDNDARRSDDDDSSYDDDDFLDDDYDDDYDDQDPAALGYYSEEEDSLYISLE